MTLFAITRHAHDKLPSSTPSKSRGPRNGFTYVVPFRVAPRPSAQSLNSLCPSRTLVPRYPNPSCACTVTPVPADTCDSYVDTDGSSLCSEGLVPIDDGASISCDSESGCDETTCCEEGEKALSTDKSMQTCAPKGRCFWGIGFVVLFCLIPLR